MTDEESTTWLQQNTIGISIVHSFNFIDFEDKDLPFKRGFIQTEKNLISGKLRLNFGLALTKASFADNLIDPFNDEVSGKI